MQTSGGQAAAKIPLSTPSAWPPTVSRAARNAWWARYKIMGCGLGLKGLRPVDPAVSHRASG